MDPLDKRLSLIRQQQVRVDMRLHHGVQHVRTFGNSIASFVAKCIADLGWDIHRRFYLLRANFTYIKIVT